MHETLARTALCRFQCLCLGFSGIHVNPWLNFNFVNPLATLYVFGIHNYGDESGTMYWSEKVGGRGSDEIGSCLWHYLNTLPIHVTSAFGHIGKNFQVSLLFVLDGAGSFGTGDMMASGLRAIRHWSHLLLFSLVMCFAYSAVEVRKELEPPEVRELEVELRGFHQVLRRGFQAQLHGHRHGLALENRRGFPCSKNDLLDFTRYLHDCWNSPFDQGEVLITALKAVPAFEKMVGQEPFE